MGIPYSINGIVKGGLGIGRNNEVYYMSKDFSSSDTSDVSKVNLMSIYGAMERNTLNNKQFSTQGTYRKLALRAGYGLELYFPGSTSQEILNERNSYFWITAIFDNIAYLHIKGPFTLGYYYTLHATFKPLLSNYYSTIIEAPVFRPTIISKSLFMEKYRDNQYIAAGLMPVYSFSQKLHAKLEAYAFFPVQEILADVTGNAYLGSYFNRMKSLYNASINYISAAGPVGFHIGYITEEEKPWVIQLSFGYLLFNKRSTEE